MPVILVDSNVLAALAVFGVVGWLAAAAALVFILVGVGREPLRLAALLASCRRKGRLVALTRVGRAIRASQAEPIHGNFWFFQVAGKPALAYVSSDAIYRLAGTDVFIVSLNNASALSVKDLEALSALGEREQRRIVSTLIANLEGPVMEQLMDVHERLRAKGEEEAARRVRAAMEEIAEAVRAGASMTLPEAVALLNRLKEKYGVNVKQILPAASAVDVALLDSLIERRVLNPRELLVLAAAQVKAVDEMVSRMVKRQQGAPILLLVIVVALVAAALLFLLR